MLQWMGGSRRKVTSTRKSTQNRQKQYFEQRKRLQQQSHLPADLESSADCVDSCRQHLQEHRSLDIVNLLNLSTLVQENRSSSIRDADTSVAKCYSIKSASTAPPDRVTPSNSVKLGETGSLSGHSGYQVENEHSKKDLHSVPDNLRNPYNEVDSKSNDSETCTQQLLSVLDLLGDDGENGNLTGSPEQEAHVAFSIEGLGKVGTETPAQSPQKIGRFSRGFSLPYKVSRHRNSSKDLNTVLNDLELEVDAIMQDIDMPPSKSSLEYSMGQIGTYGNPKQKLSSVNSSIQYVDPIETHRYFGVKEMMYEAERENRDIWGDSSFQDHHFHGERDYDDCWKNWQCQLDSESADFFSRDKYEIPDNTFNGPYPPKKRVAAKTEDRFTFLEPKASFSKQRTSDYEFDSMMLNESRYPNVASKFDVGGEIQPDWFCSMKEDARDSFSLLSEESCSTSAVRGETISSSPPNSRRRRNISGNKCTIEDDITQGDHHAQGSGKYVSPLRLKPLHHSNSPFLENFGSSNAWFVEKECTSTEKNSGLSSSVQTARKLPSKGSFSLTEDPLIAPPIIKSPFFSIQPARPVVFSSSATFSSERLATHRPSGNNISDESPILSKNGFGSLNLNLFKDSNPRVIGTDLAPESDSHGDVMSAVSSEQGSVGKDEENQSKFLREEFELGNDISTENKNCDRNVAKDGSIDGVGNLKATCSPKHAAGTPSSMRDHKSGSTGDEKQSRDNHRVTFSCPKEEKDTREDVGVEERKMVIKKKSAESSSSKVMMLESYVLQLLCLKKVMEAHLLDTMKNV